jgi:NAD+ synthetase
MNYELAVKNIRSELKDYISKGNLQSLVLGVSGGIDSTLCALLAKPVCEELNIPLIGRSLPSNTNSKGENSRAKEIGNLFCTDFKETSIKAAFNKLSDVAYDNHNVLPENYPDGEDYGNQILNGNIKARIRMILLYDIAGGNNGMVLSTDNYTEYLLGFWTLHGDVGDYGMIQNLWKTEVYEMTEYIAKKEYTGWKGQLQGHPYDVIMDVINADATDGLGISKTDLDQILPGWEGNSRDGYKLVDLRLMTYISSKLNDLTDPVIQRHLKSEFKRQNPYNIPWNKIIGIPDNIYNK